MRGGSAEAGHADPCPLARDLYERGTRCRRLLFGRRPACPSRAVRLLVGSRRAHWPPAILASAGSAAVSIWHRIAAGADSSDGWRLTGPWVVDRATG